jgi:glycosyltransferase involved in cell wall biosynthesis
MRIITRLNVGGPAYQAIYLTERLRGPEFDSALLVGDVGPREGSLEGLAAARGVALAPIAGLGREISLRSDGLTVGRLYREMRRFRPDVVHTHMAKAGAVGRLAAHLARVPAVVHTYHGHVFHGYFSPRKTELFLRIERMLARWTDRLVVLGEAQEREILGFGVGRPAQMVRIPLGLELGPFLRAEERRGELRRELGLPRSTSLVGIVARLVPIKAHDLFLEAARRVALARPDTQFLIVGDGELRERLEQQACSLGFKAISSLTGSTGSTGSGRVRRPTPYPVHPVDPVKRIRNEQSVVYFLGLRDDLPAIYADLDLLVLCSRNEGLPVTIIEALAAARPVVSTEVGAVRDLITPGETGRSVPPDDVGALTCAMLDQLDDRGGAEAMARRGRAHVSSRFSIDRLEADLRQLYHDLLGAPGCENRKKNVPVRQEGERSKANPITT